MINMENKFSYSTFFKDNWNTKFPNGDEAQRMYHIFRLLFLPLSKFTHKPDLLEVGSGRGWLSNILNLYTNVTGIEPETDICQLAQQTLPDIKFLNYGLTEFYNSHKAQFDIIVCSEVIEHVPYPNQDEFINQLYALLKPGGVLVITTPRQEVFTKWSRNRTVFQTIENWITEGALNQKLRENNFTVLQHYSFSPLKPKIGFYAKKLRKFFSVREPNVYQIALATKPL